MRRICIFTSTRADYGLLMGLMKEISLDPEMELQIIASGTHLVEKFGLTYKLIEQDGFSISEKVDIYIDDSSPAGVCASQGRALELYAKSLENLAPAIAVVLGDRFEALSFAIACSQLAIPLAHIHGGELTLGAVDDGFRHAITKLSFWHFTAAEEYKRRVIQLGEAQDRTWNVGALGVENVKKLSLKSKELLSKELGIQWQKKNLLITFHPETNTHINKVEQIKSLLTALEVVTDETGFIFTYPNIDPGHDLILHELNQFVTRLKPRAAIFQSMGQINYLSAMKVVDAVVGNSSSGVIEAPSFFVPTVNIGDRQKGRIRASSVIDCSFEISEIEIALNKILSSDFKKSVENTLSPLDGGDTANKIKEVLKKIIIPSNLQKEFYDRLE